MSKYIWAILIVLALIGIFILSYIVNHHTPKPEGCENLEPDCGHCPVEGCIIRNKEQIKKEDTK